MRLGIDHRMACSRLSRMKPLHHAALLACISVGSVAASENAWAQATGTAVQSAAAAHYDIPAGTLDQVLNRFATSAGILLSFDSRLTAGKSSPGLHGNYNIPGALTAILGRHELETSPGMGGGYVVRRSPGTRAPAEAPSHSTLPIVTITAEADKGSATEATGSYKLFGTSHGATKLSLTPQETPQSLSIVTRQRMDDQRLHSMIDVLDATIGVSSFRQSIGADLAQPYSRGFSISNYLIDGIPRPATSGSDRLNTAAFDRVEVLRGATGLTSGMGYPGASINMVRKRPTSEAQSSATVEAGSWDRYGVGLDISRPLTERGNVRGRLVLDSKEQKSWVDRYKGKSSLIYAIAEADISPDTLLTVGLSNQKNNSDSPLRSGVRLYYPDGSKIGLPTSYNPAPNWSYYNTEEFNLFSSLRHNFSEDWRAALEFGYLKDELDGVGYWAGGTIDRSTGLGASYAPVHWDDRSRQYNIDAYVNGKFPLLGKTHDLVGGFSISDRKGHSINYGGWLYSWNSSYNGAVNSSIWSWDGSQANVPQFVKSGDTFARTKEYSAYLTSRLHLTEQAKLIVGARTMYWENVGVETTVAGASSESKKKEKGVIVPYAGLIYQLNDNWSAYGSYTQIFRPQSASVVDINRKPLDPEEGKAYEVGLKGAILDKGLNVAIALFDVQQDKVAEYDSTIGAYKLLEGINTKGAEIELSGELRNGWNISAGYAYSISKDKAGKRVMERIPKHTIKTFTTYRLPGDMARWTVGGGVTWMSRYGWEDSQAYGWDYQRSYMLASLMARYKISQATEITANINNLFGKTHFSAIADVGVYGPPRSIMISMKHRF